MQISAAETFSVKHRRRLLAPLPALLVALFVLALPATSSAKKTHLPLETFGSVAQPKFKRPNGLAVDRSNGDLLVIDAGTMTVSRFHPDGTPADFSALGTNVIDGKGAGDGTPQSGLFFRSGLEQQVAIDNSGTITDGNIYITQGHETAGHLIDIFSSTGVYLGQITGAPGVPFASAGSFPFSPCGVAVDGSGSLFVGTGYENKVYKFDPSTNPPLNADLVATYTHGEPLCNLAAGAGPSNGSVFANLFFRFKNDSVLKLAASNLALQGIVGPPEARLLTVDPANGHLYAFGGATANQDTGTLFENPNMREYDVTNGGSRLVSTFRDFDVSGVAVDGSSGRIYISPTNTDDNVDVYGPLVTIPDVTTGATAITGDTSVSLNGIVNPDGEALEECFFEYGPTISYGQTVPCAESMAEIGTSSKAVHAEISGLTAEASYHYRLVAKNANDTVEGQDKAFRTPGKPVIAGVWSTDVGLGEARIEARLNPENSPTTYRFEWGLSSGYEHSTAEIAIGTGEADRVVGLQLDELAPETTYHYRVVASNGIGTGESTDHTFTTFPASLAPKTDCPNQGFRTGVAATLPDCRAYEMVSPVNKNGSDIRTLLSFFSYPARLDQSSLDGESFAYSAVVSFGDAKSTPWTSQYVATRHPGEAWSTKAISPPRHSVSLTSLANKFDSQFKAFSPDLSQGWLFHDTDPPLGECAQPGFPNLYRRDNSTGEYEALVSSKPVDVPVSEFYTLELQGLSADGSATVFRTNAKLTPDAASEAIQLYEHVRGEGCGELRLVNILPNGKVSTEGSATAGQLGFGGDVAMGESRNNTVLRAVSADGSRIFWSFNGPANSPSLYLRDMQAGKTVQLSSFPAQFWSAAVDGSKAIYRVSSGPLKGNLYEFDSEKGLAGKAASALIADGVEGVTATSEDASRVYFVSTKALEGEGEEGEPNLYLYDSAQSGAERYELVATITDKDVAGRALHNGFGVASEQPIMNGVRSTPDAGQLAFVSTASLTGYDNKDAKGGQPSLEIYLYDADTAKLACVSCNPTGARPRARLFGALPVSAQMPPGETQIFAPRVLSEDGSRLFFESFEALLPRDTNGKADVYQWQRSSDEAGCEAAGAELYVASAEGCLSLISTGQSPSDSEIADVTPDGSDVFIRTASSLLPQDAGQIDIYDARQNGGLPQPPAPTPSCEGEACQGPLAAPDDPTPASSSFVGSGNVSEKQAKKKQKKAHRRKTAKKKTANKRQAKKQQRAKHNGRAGR